MRSLALLALLAAPTACAHDTPRRVGDCVLYVGPNDRVRQDADVTVEDGEELNAAVAIHADVVVRRGGRVTRAIALGGDVVLEPGAIVEENAAAIGGDVRVGAGARVGEDAVALGGRVRLAEGARVDGDVVGLSLQLGKELRARLLAELASVEPSCRIEVDGR